MNANTREKTQGYFQSDFRLHIPNYIDMSIYDLSLNNNTYMDVYIFISFRRSSIRCHLDLDPHFIYHALYNPCLIITIPYAESSSLITKYQKIPWPINHLQFIRYSIIIRQRVIHLFFVFKIFLLFLLLLSMAGFW